MNILIPLGIGSKWDNNELRYCLRSIEENLKGDYSIHIYGQAPEWLTNVCVTNTERFYPEWLKEINGRKLDYENFFDTLNKIKMFSELQKKGKFLYMYDDQLFVKEIIIEDIKNVPVQQETNEMYRIRKRDKHGRTINRSIDLLCYSHGDDLPYNFETHIPRIYDCHNLAQMFANFDFTKEIIPFTLATLYFNLNPDEATFIPLSEQNIKAGFYFDDEGIASYMSGSMEEIERAIIGKMYVNYNDSGLNVMATDRSGKQYLKEWIMNRFPNKSKYEL